MAGLLKKKKTKLKQNHDSLSNSCVIYTPSDFQREFEVT